MREITRKLIHQQWFRYHETWPPWKIFILMIVVESTERLLSLTYSLRGFAMDLPYMFIEKCCYIKPPVLIIYSQQHKAQKHWLVHWLIHCIPYAPFRASSNISMIRRAATSTWRVASILRASLITRPCPCFMKVDYYNRSMLRTVALTKTFLAHTFQCFSISAIEKRSSSTIFSNMKGWWDHYRIMLCTAQLLGPVLKAFGRVQFSPLQLADKSPMITDQHTAGGSVSPLSQLAKLSLW